MKTLLINNFSPFIDNIVKLLNELENSFECYDCNQIHALDTHLDLLERFDNVILSGRQQNSSLINKINSRIVKGCFVLDKPLLGICYGGQILGLTLGCTLKKIQKIKDTIEINLINRHPYLKVINQLGCTRATISAFRPFPMILGCLELLLTVIMNYSVLIKNPYLARSFSPEKSGKPGRDLMENFLNIR